MTDDILVQLSVPITNYEMKGDRLYVTNAPALVEGWWRGMDGVKRFYPRSIIKESTDQFNNHDIVCEHLGLPIGKITKMTKIDEGFLTNFYLTHKPSMKSVLRGEKRGLSIQAFVTLSSADPRIVTKIYDVQHIALVEKPACEVCNITDANIQKGLVSMSEGIIEEGEVVEEVSEDDDLVDLDGIIESSKDFVDDGVQSTSIETPPIEEKIEEVILPSEITVPLVEVKTEDTRSTSVDLDHVNGPPLVAEVSMSAEPIVGFDVEGLKVALSAATTTIEAVSKQLLDLTGKLHATEVSLSAKDAELNETKGALEETQTLAKSFESKIAELQEQLKVVEMGERNKIINDIQAKDPLIDSVVLDSMTMVQLSAYKDSFDRATKGMIGGERKATKIDESTAPKVSLSAPKSKPTTREVAASVSKYLAAVERQNNTMLRV